MPNNRKYAWMGRPVEWSISCFGLFSSFSCFRTRRLSSNPTASTDLNRYQTGRCETPVFCRFARLEKRLHLGCATRNTTPQAPCTDPAWTLQNSKAIGQKCEKPWENQGFAAEIQKANGEDRIRTCGKELTLRRISNPVL